MSKPILEAGRAERTRTEAAPKNRPLTLWELNPIPLFKTAKSREGAKQLIALNDQMAKLCAKMKLKVSPRMTVASAQELCREFEQMYNALNGIHAALVDVCKGELGAEGNEISYPRKVRRV